MNNLFSRFPECHVCRLPVTWKDGFIDQDTGQISHHGKCRLEHYRQKQGDNSGTTYSEMPVTEQLYQKFLKPIAGEIS